MSKISKKLKGGRGTRVILPKEYYEPDNIQLGGAKKKKRKISSKKKKRKSSTKKKKRKSLNKYHLTSNSPKLVTIPIPIAPY